eukprot:TRINITY_DN14113_c0_g1_i1.p1 TRINITY_DN14113_c0_g1~~TRINITY_DN14113_c0_g1_i1.p1  ORF type:complete len:1780 (+),score=510.26 TRINITY_DN14113_c0_g1_i1:85-5424(+)
MDHRWAQRPKRRRSALVAIATAAAVVTETHYASALPAPASPDTAVHWADPRCDAVGLRRWSYLSTAAANVSFGLSLPAPDSSVQQGSTLAVSLDGLLWLQPAAGNTSSLWVLKQDEHHRLFRPHDWLKHEFGGRWYRPSSGMTPWEVYLSTYAETAWVLAEMLQDAAQLVADTTYAALTIASPQGGSRRELAVWSVPCAARASADFSPPCGTESTARNFSAPSLASPWLTYVTTPEPCPAGGSGCRSMAWLQDLTTGSREPLGYLDDRAHNPYASAVWNMTRYAFPEEGSPSAAVAAVAWLSLPAADEVSEVPAVGGGTVVQPTVIDAARNATVSVMQLPSRAECTLGPSQWRVDAQGVTLDTVRDIAGGGSFVFALVSGRKADGSELWGVAGLDLSASATYPSLGGCVAAADCAACRFTLYPGTVHPRPLRKLDGTVDGLLFAAQTGTPGDEEHWIVRSFAAPVQRGMTSQEVVCRLFDYGAEAGVAAVAIHDDLVVYESAVQSAAGTPRFARIDLDRDNDRFWDSVDRFPFDGDYQYDSDNDGIGDAADILHNGGECHDDVLDSPESCWDDIRVLYITYGCITAVMLVACFLVGKYREHKRERLATQRLATQEELNSRQLEEEVMRTAASQPQVSDADLLRMIQRLDEKEQQKSKADRLEKLCQVILLALAVSSVALLVAAEWDSGACNKSGFSLYTEAVVAWVDLYTSTIFAIDLGYRWFFREDKSQTFRQFAQENWYDWPSLVTDIPGFTTAGALNALTVARLLRLARIIKVFRVVRLYRKVTHTQTVANLILRYSTLWQLIFLIVLILVVAVILKIVEQEEQDSFCEYGNVLWFCMVTVTTVGYGDMVPINWFSRVLAMLLMLCGIGIIGVLTGTMGEPVRFSGVGKEQLDEMRRRRLLGTWQLRIEILRNSVMYNPILSVFRPFGRTSCSHPNCGHGGIIADSVGSITVSYGHTQHKFHYECFKCTKCGQGPAQHRGQLWVHEQKDSERPQEERGRFAGPQESDKRKCYANLYLHADCIPPDKGRLLGIKLRRPSQLGDREPAADGDSDTVPYPDSPSSPGSPKMSKRAVFPMKRASQCTTSTAGLSEIAVRPYCPSALDAQPEEATDPGNGGGAPHGGGLIQIEPLALDTREEYDEHQMPDPGPSPEKRTSRLSDHRDSLGLARHKAVTGDGESDHDSGLGDRQSSHRSAPHTPVLRVESSSGASREGPRPADSPRRSLGEETSSGLETETDEWDDPQVVPADLVELSVSGLEGKWESLNGNYTVRMADQGKGAVWFEHQQVRGRIEWSDTYEVWRLIDNSRKDRPRCVSSSPRLLSKHGKPWAGQDKGGKVLTGFLKRRGSSMFGVFGCRPVVESAVIQEAGFHRVYDQLDVPVRRLIMNYASTRIRKQWSNAPDAVEVSAGGGGGKFNTGSQGGAKAAFEKALQWERLRHQMRVVQSLDARRQDLEYPCQLQDRLELLLRTHRLDEDRRIKNFDLLHDLLEYTIFFKPLSVKNGLTVERLFTIKAALDMAQQAQERATHKQRSGADEDDASDITDWGHVTEDEIDWSDCIETTLGTVDRILKEHGVNRHEKFSEIRVELEHIALAHDRVLMCRWAWKNLVWKNYSFERPVRQHGKKADMPPVPFANRNQYCDEKAGQAFLDPLAAELDRLQCDDSRFKDRMVADASRPARRVASRVPASAEPRPAGPETEAVSRQFSMLDSSAVQRGPHSNPWGKKAGRPRRGSATAARLGAAPPAQAGPVAERSHTSPGGSPTLNTPGLGASTLGRRFF